MPPPRLKEAILEQLERLDEDQQRRVLNFISALANRETAPPQAVEPLDDAGWARIRQAIDEDAEGIEADEW